MKFISKSNLKKVAIILLMLFGLLQFIPKPKKNIRNVKESASIDKLYPVTDSVVHILKVACYDCHSNNTFYPWYSNLQHVA